MAIGKIKPTSSDRSYTDRRPSVEIEQSSIHFIWVQTFLTKSYGLTNIYILILIVSFSIIDILVFF